MSKFDMDEQMAFCFNKPFESSFPAPDYSKVININEVRGVREETRKKLHERDVISRIVKMSERLRW